MKNILSALVAAAVIGLLSPQEAPAGSPVDEQPVNASFETSLNACEYYEPPQRGVSCSEVEQYCANQYLYNCCYDSCGGAACAIQTQQQYESCLYSYRCGSRPGPEEPLPC
ncbi:hypothetical protein F0U60_10445 [Archangium minus]|uniref:Uncharacterized protein n=1 Tax=Archangium minus TaxID=83450 RepID=A0ABY9WRW1_9BACT|nr:hypothetical protein F0U60_10445 [Archangium minus]